MRRPARPKIDQFVLWCRAHALPEPEREHRFHLVRQWRFDYAWPRCSVAIEVDGGIFTRGRHTRGVGFLKDMEKLNQAQICGWKVLRYTPQQLMTEGTLTDLILVLK